MSIEQRIKEAKKMNCDLDYDFIDKRMNWIIEELDNAQFHAVLKVVTDTRDPFVQAKKKHLDIEKPLKCLQTARDLLKDGEFYRAYRMAKKGEKMINQLLLKEATTWKE